MPGCSGVRSWTWLLRKCASPLRLASDSKVFKKAWALRGSSSSNESFTRWNISVLVRESRTPKMAQMTALPGSLAGSPFRRLFELEKHLASLRNKQHAFVLTIGEVFGVDAVGI